MGFWTNSKTIMLGGSVSVLQEVYQHFQSIFGTCFTAQMTSFQEQIMQLRDGTEGSKRMFLPVIVFLKFLEVLQKEETVVRVEILQNEGGHQPPPQRRYVDCNQRILRIVDDFPNRQRIDYLRSIAHNLAY